MRNTYLAICVLHFMAMAAMAQESPRYEMFFGYGLVRKTTFELPPGYSCRSECG